jgi:hypothetical protein
MTSVTCDPFLAHADAHLERRPRRHGTMTAALEHTCVQEGVAGTASELHEAETFARVVPFDDSLKGRAGGRFELWTAGRRIAEIAGRRLVVVVFETTAAWWAEISVSVSHVGFPAYELTYSRGRS